MLCPHLSALGHGVQTSRMEVRGVLAVTNLPGCHSLSSPGPRDAWRLPRVTVIQAGRPPERVPITDCPCLPVGRLRPREGKELAQGHTAQPSQGTGGLMLEPPTSQVPPIAVRVVIYFRM